MKALKTKLLVSVAMVLVAAVMLSTSAFAWFTISTNPEVTAVSANVTANGNLEIALDAGSDTAPEESAIGDNGKNEAWGNVVDLGDFFTGAGDAKTVTLKPVELTAAGSTVTIKAPNYVSTAEDGAVKEVVALNRVNAADGTTADADFQDFGGIWLYTDDADALGTAGTKDTSIYAIEIDIWLRTNATGSTVSLSTAVDRAADITAGRENPGATGLGSYITDEKNVTVLIQDGEDFYVCVRGTKAGDKYPLTLAAATIAEDGKVTAGAAASIALTANTAKELKIFIFMNGAELTNAKALLETAVMDFNIQFSSSATLESEDVATVAAEEP